jgi:hypothetical protein
MKLYSNIAKAVDRINSELSKPALDSKKIKDYALAVRYLTRSAERIANLKGIKR